MWNRDIAPDFIEKIISSLCYLPMGFFIGIGYILFNGKGSNNRFFRFHFFQSIILMIMITILQMGSKSVTGIFVALLQIVAAPFLSDFGVVVEAIYMTVDIFVKAFGLLMVYGLLWALFGKYAEIPFISNVVRQNLR